MADAFTNSERVEKRRRNSGGEGGVRESKELKNASTIEFLRYMTIGLPIYSEMRIHTFLSADEKMAQSQWRIGGCSGDGRGDALSERRARLLPQNALPAMNARRLHLLVSTSSECAQQT